MQHIYLSHKTALFIYRQLRTYDRLHKFNQLTTSKLPKSIHLTNREIFDKAYSQCSLKQFDILLGSKNCCFNTSKIQRHYFLGKLPEDSFYALSRDVAVVSPELLFCQMASSFDFISMLLFGLEICGSFTLNKESVVGFDACVRPLTSKQKILNYIKNLKTLNNNFPFIIQAEKVAVCLSDGSASPQESRLFVSLCAPRNIGGYGIKGGELNQPIKLSKEGASICGQEYLVPDICFKRNKIAIEYDSNYFHDNAYQNNKDKCRLDAYIHEGWKVFTFVPQHLRNRESFHNMAMDILRANGQDKRIRAQNFSKLRKNMHDCLYNKTSCKKDVV